MKKQWLAAFLSVLLVVCGISVPAGAEENDCQYSTEEAKEYRIPTEVVQERLKGGINYLDRFGVTRKKVVAELTAHEHDDYYLNTPFVGGDWQSPRGDISYNGAPGTNCAGFVAYVLRKCGMDTVAVQQVMRASGKYTNWGSGRPHDGLASASNYMGLAVQGKIISYAFPSKAAMLASGKAEKGDLVLRFWTNEWGGWDEDNHLMIFWGNTPQEDKVWQNASGRLHIGQMWDEDDSSFVLIKFAPSGPPAPLVEGFRDVWETLWYAEDVRYVSKAGLMKGTLKDQFSPQEPLLRGQLVSILWRMSGEPAAGLPEDSPAFADVEANQYYAEAVNWAEQAGIVKGYPDGTFRPGQPVSRQEMAAILYSYCSWRGLDTEARSDLSGYTDRDLIDSYAEEALSWASATGLITGHSSGAMDPLSQTQRCQAAAVFRRLCHWIEQATEEEE